MRRNWESRGRNCNQDILCVWKKSIFNKWGKRFSVTLRILNIKYKLNNKICMNSVYCNPQNGNEINKRIYKAIMLMNLNIQHHNDAKVYKLINNFHMAYRKRSSFYLYGDRFKIMTVKLVIVLFWKDSKVIHI